MCSSTSLPCRPLVLRGLNEGQKVTYDVAMERGKAAATNLRSPDLCSRIVIGPAQTVCALYPHTLSAGPFCFRSVSLSSRVRRGLRW